MRQSVRQGFTVSVHDGLIEPALQRPTSNQDHRPAGCDPELIVLHGISLPPGDFGGAYIEQFFNNTLDWDAHPYFAEIRGLEVSAHVLIRRDGAVIQFVPFHQRAWHAGESSFRGRPRCNDFSIGIEIEGEDHIAYAEEQYTSLAELIRALLAAYPGLHARCIAGHCDVSPGRKSDPGPAFDWLRLYDGLRTNP